MKSGVRQHAQSRLARRFATPGVHAYPVCHFTPAPVQLAERRPRRPRRREAGEPRALDAIINEGTLTIGWVGPALLGILIAAFGWAGRVFEWLGTLATWLFSGEWRGD